MRRYQIHIGESDYDISVRADGENFVVTVNGQERSVSVVDISPRRAHFIIDSLSREIDLRKDGDDWVAMLEGRSFEASVVDFHLAELKKTAGATHEAHMPKELKAPMPGMVLKVDVAVGAEVSKGDTLVVLEAMKMENQIKAAGSGVVKRIIVESGASVEKGQALIEFA
jgi:biotin carboxyl carrier protein